MHAELDDLFSLRGRTAVITGGSSGIGREMARTLALAGASVVLVARRSEPLRQAADDLRAAGATAAWLSGDLGDRPGIRQVADELSAVSKAAVAALTRSQAEAWSSRGVCVNAVAPGFVHTPLTEAVFRDPERTRAMANRTMVGRNSELSDFTGVTLFLAGNSGAYVTGQTIFVDGGFSAT